MSGAPNEKRTRRDFASVGILAMRVGGALLEADFQPCGRAVEEDFVGC